MEITGKTFIVTGAGSGLGRATALALEKNGAQVTGFDYQWPETTSADEHQWMDRKTVDVGDESQVRTGIREVTEKYGALHGVVNSAGILAPAKLISGTKIYPTKLWDRVIRTNLTGSFNMMRYAALAMSENQMVSNEARGVIINTSSGAAWNGQKGQIGYSASKAALLGMLMPAAKDLADIGIRVMAIAPGLFQTAMSDGMPDKVKEGIVNNQMLYPKRMGAAAEYADLVLSIIRNEYLNASCIRLDGGTH